MMNFSIDEFLIATLKEDIGTGDITTLSCIPKSAVSKGAFRAKQSGIICGTEILKRIFEIVDPAVSVNIMISDGEKVEVGDIIAYVEGPSQSVLSAERTALNIVQHLSGIATETKKAVDAVKGTKAKITDTRKTTPGMRVLEKYAVKMGGGFNHRFNLADGVLIKDNHIVAAGGIAEAVKMVRENIPHTLKIEVETENLEQVKEALNAGADIIMLDNMTNDKMKEAVDYIAGRALTEASGNMGEKDLASVAACGVDIISIGALTHTVKALDISLKFFE